MLIASSHIRRAFLPETHHMKRINPNRDKSLRIRRFCLERKNNPEMKQENRVHDTRAAGQRATNEQPVASGPTADCLDEANQKLGPNRIAIMQRVSP